jgi:hypothetical protein
MTDSPKEGFWTERNWMSEWCKQAKKENESEKVIPLTRTVSRFSFVTTYLDISAKASRGNHDSSSTKQSFVVIVQSVPDSDSFDATPIIANDESFKCRVQQNFDVLHRCNLAKHWIDDIATTGVDCAKSSWDRMSTKLCDPCAELDAQLILHPFDRIATFLDYSLYQVWMVQVSTCLEEIVHHEFYAILNVGEFLPFRSYSSDLPSVHNRVATRIRILFDKENFSIGDKRCALDCRGKTSKSRANDRYICLV